MVFLEANPSKLGYLIKDKKNRGKMPPKTPSSAGAFETITRSAKPKQEGKIEFFKRGLTHESCAGSTRMGRGAKLKNGVHVGRARTGKGGKCWARSKPTAG